MEIMLTRFFLFSQVFLLLASILVTSTILNNDVPTEPVTNKYKYYANKKGTQVVEVGPSNLCEIFHGPDANWLRENKREVITVLNYIQFRLLVGKCQLDAIFKPLIHSSPSQELPNNNHITTSENFSSVNNNMSKNKQQGGSGAGTDTGGGLVPGAQFNQIHNRNGTTTIDEDGGETKEDEDDVQELQPLKKPTNSPATSSSISSTDTPAPTEKAKQNSSSMPLIFPGTKWCGAGSSARFHEDLGVYAHTDRCCRDHDLCPENMAGKECKYGLCNDSDFTRSSCDCDYEFRLCLQKDRSLSSFASFKIANLYFNILKPLCYARRPPVKSCRRHRITGECVDFEFDSDYDQEWQFFPAQPYLSAVVENLITPVVLPQLSALAPPPVVNGEEDRVQLLKPRPQQQQKHHLGPSPPSSSLPKPQGEGEPEEENDDEDESNEEDGN